MKIITVIRQYMASRIGALRAAFDIRDVFFFCGMALLGYGLWLFRPWVGFSVSGFLLMFTGYLMKAK